VGLAGINVGDGGTVHVGENVGGMGEVPGSCISTASAGEQALKINKTNTKTERIGRFI
jgi:hypothetical protein